MSATRVLYWGSGSSPAWRVQAALDEKNLEYESKMVEFSKGGHKAPEILALNPRGQVPTLKDGEIVINESLAALHYLERAYPEPALVPKDQAGYAAVLQRVEEANNLFILFKDVIVPKMRKLLKTEDDEKAWLEKVEGAKKELAFWNSYAEKNDFIAGSTFSLADLAAAPLLLAIQRFGASFDANPALKAYVARIAERPSIAKNWPPHWKTSPPTTILVGHL